MSIRFDHPELLWLVLLAVPIVWLGRRSLAALEPGRRWTAIALRLTVLLLIVLMLANVQTVQKHTDLTVVAVLDQSESVRRFGRVPGATPQDGQSVEQWMRDWLNTATQDRRPTDRFGLITYDRRPTVRQLPGADVNLDAGVVSEPLEGSDTASATQAAMAVKPADTGQRIVLATDGNDTTGNLRQVALEAAAAGVVIDVLPIEYDLRREVMVEAVYAPTEVRRGQAAPLRIVMRATEPTGGTLQLMHDDVLVDLNGEAEGAGAPIDIDDWTLEQGEQSADASARYVSVKVVDLSLEAVGPNQFRAVFEPAEGGDVMSVNNTAEAFTLVAGRGKVLFVTSAEGPSAAVLPDALSAHGIELEVVTPAGLPSRASVLQRYDAVILQDVPADMVTGPQQRMLARYVNDLGGGLVMVGGPDSFGAGGWTNSPIDQILPVNCRIPSKTVLPTGALVLVIDRSGSMAAPVAGTIRTQQELANEAAVLAVATLYPEDMVGVVAFDSFSRLVVDVQRNDDPHEVAKRIRSMRPGGGTNIYEGLELAYERLAPIDVDEAAIKHVILLTDGDSEPPPGGSYLTLVSKMTAANITLSTIGVGDGHNAALLALLARSGGGKYHPITNPNNLPQVFIKEAKTIRRNLIREKPFTPTVQQTGSPIMTGINSVPPLRGFVLTGPKRDSRVFMPIIGPEGEPIFAHWQVGLGRAAAFTSDATNRWAVDWLRWGGYGDFWARTLRAIARPARGRDVDLFVDVENDRLRVRVDAADLDATGMTSSFADLRSFSGSVLGPDGQTTPVTLEQTGPGRYEADLPAAQSGNYIVSLIGQGDDGERRHVVGGVSRPPGEELRQFQSNTAVLNEVAAITGGRVLDPVNPADAALFERTSAFESRSVRPLWRTLLWALIVLFLLDVASRRIAWDFGAMARWVRGLASTLFGALQTRDLETEQTLGALKRSRRGAAPDAEPAPLATKRFEAPPDAVAGGDFADAVGGAKSPRDSVYAARSTEGDQAETATTSQLLAAKRRAREQLQGEKEQ